MKDSIRITAKTITRMFLNNSRFVIVPIEFSLSFFFGFMLPCIVLFEPWLVDLIPRIRELTFVKAYKKGGAVYNGSSVGAIFGTVTFLISFVFFLAYLKFYKQWTLNFWLLLQLVTNTIVLLGIPLCYLVRKFFSSFEEVKSVVVRDEKVQAERMMKEENYLLRGSHAPSPDDILLRPAQEDTSNLLLPSAFDSRPEKPPLRSIIR